MNFKTRLEYAEKLDSVLRETAEALLARKGTEIHDTRSYKGHEESNIDVIARTAFIAAFDKHLSHFQGLLRFELDPFFRTPMGARKTDERLTALVDELDGTTAAKRSLASVIYNRLGYPIPSSICIAVCTGEKLGDIQVGVTLALDSMQTYVGLRTEDDSFIVLVNGTLFTPAELEERRGDSRNRLVVCEYSISHETGDFLRSAEIRQALAREGFDAPGTLERNYGSSGKSSAMDVINALRNQWDAYIDPRAAWGDSKGAKLHSYDVASVIPLALGAGWCVSDIYGKSWKTYRFDRDMPIIISRPNIHSQIVGIVKPVIQRQVQQTETRSQE